MRNKTIRWSTIFLILVCYKEKDNNICLFVQYNYYDDSVISVKIEKVTENCP